MLCTTNFLKQIHFTKYVTWFGHCIKFASCKSSKGNSDTARGKNIKTSFTLFLKWSIHPEAVARKCSVKKVFWVILQK